jgi:histidinol-phosphate aminotransferase
MKFPAFIRPEVQQLAAYVPGEQPRDQKYIKLNTNENPYPPSPRVLEAIRAEVGEHLRLYPDPVATELRVKAASRYGLTPDCILAGNGSDELLTMIMRACLAPGDRVVYPTPTYSLYQTLVEIQTGLSVEIPFPPDFRLPSADLGEQGQKITIVCNPNAPSGTLTPVAEIARLAEQLSGLVVVDEAYVDFAEGSALSLIERHANVLVLRTFSKSFALCGMRVGLAFAQPQVIAALFKVKDSYNLGRLPQVAACAALDDYAWMEAQVAKVCASRQLLTAGLIKRGFGVLPSHTNFVLARTAGVSLKSTQQALKQKGVLVRYFDTPELLDCLRITVGTDEEVQALFKALDEVRAS